LPHVLHGGGGVFRLQPLEFQVLNLALHRLHPELPEARDGPGIKQGEAHVLALVGDEHLARPDPLDPVLLLPGLHGLVGHPGDGFREV